MKYVLAGGGTGGHINPAIAIAEEIVRRDPEAQILIVRDRPDASLPLSLAIKGTVEWSLAHTGKESGSKDKHENETAHRSLATVF